MSVQSCAANPKYSSVDVVENRKRMSVLQRKQNEAFSGVEASGMVSQDSASAKSLMQSGGDVVFSLKASVVSGGTNNLPPIERNQVIF